MRVAQTLIAIALIGIVALALTLASRQPSNARDWDEAVARQSFLQMAGDTATLVHLRNWEYGNATVLTKRWETREIDLADMTGIRLYTMPFARWGRFAHNLVVFEFGHQPPIGVSIEARREAGEDYNPLSGLMRAYELSYVWATERDLLARRAALLGERIYSYPLATTLAERRAVFDRLARETNRVREEPRFYNTLLTNCTNTLADAINRETPGALPWAPAFVLTGDAPAYLHMEGRIAGARFKGQRPEAEVTASAREAASRDELAFMQAVRAAGG